MNTKCTFRILLSAVILFLFLCPPAAHATCDIHGRVLTPGCCGCFNCGFNAHKCGKPNGGGGGASGTSTGASRQQAELERQRQVNEDYQRRVQQETQRKEQEAQRLRESQQQFSDWQEKRQREQQAQFGQQQRALQNLNQNLNNSFQEIFKPKQYQDDDIKEEDDDYTPQPQYQPQPAPTPPVYQPAVTPPATTYRPAPVPAAARPLFDAPLSSFVNSSSREAASKLSRTGVGSLSDFLTPSPVPTRTARPAPAAKPANTAADLLDDLTSPAGATQKVPASK